MNPKLTHLSRTIARLALVAMLLMQFIPSIQAQEVRITKFTRGFEGVGGYILLLDTAITNAGPESFLERTNILVDWSLSDAGHRMTKTYWDYFGGVGQQFWPQGSWERLNYVRDEWPALPDLGINYVYYGPNRLYSDGARTNTSPVDNRGTGEFRYASYTNDTSTSETFVFSDENGNAITNTVINTNRVAETTKWEAELKVGGEPGGTNIFLIEVNFKPTDDEGNFVAPGEISFGTNVLDDSWNFYIECQEAEIRPLVPTFAQTVKSATGGPGGGTIMAQLNFKNDGPFSADNKIGDAQHNLDRFGLDAQGNQIFPQCGGPQMHYNSRNSPLGFDSIGHTVELSVTVPGTDPLSNFRFKQNSIGETFSVSFDDNDCTTIIVDVPIDNIQDDPLQGNVQRSPGRQMFMVDGPGPKATEVFSYFGEVPPCDPSWPQDANIVSISSELTFATVLMRGNAIASDLVKWKVRVDIFGSSMAFTSSSAIRL